MRKIGQRIELLSKKKKEENISISLEIHSYHHLAYFFCEFQLLFHWSFFFFLNYYFFIFNIFIIFIYLFINLFIYRKNCWYKRILKNIRKKQKNIYGYIIKIFFLIFSSFYIEIYKGIIYFNSVYSVRFKYREKNI